MENNKTIFLYNWLIKNGSINSLVVQDMEGMQEAIRNIKTLNTSLNAEMASCLGELEALEYLNVHLQEGLGLNNLNSLHNLRALHIYEGSKWHDGEEYGVTIYYEHPMNLTGLSLLEELWINLSNETNTLQVEGLETLTNLEILRFNVVNMPEGCVGAFKHFTKLRTFVLSANISRLPEGTFSNLTNLSNLTLNPKFEYLPQGIEHLENLQFLHVHFQKGNICLDRLENLRELSLSFSDSDEIRKIEIPPLPYLQNVFINITNLLNTAIHVQHSNFGRVRELHLNIISEGKKDPFLFVEGLEDLEKFRVFKIRTDFIKEIPSYLSGLPLTIFCIEKLNFKYDTFCEAIPDVIRKMTTLRVLGLQGLGMTYIQEWICELNDLEELYLQDNIITDLPKSLKTMTNLKEVRIDLMQVMNTDDPNEQVKRLKESLPEGCRLEITDHIF